MPEQSYVLNEEVLRVDRYKQIIKKIDQDIENINKWISKLLDDYHLNMKLNILNQNDDDQSFGHASRFSTQVSGFVTSHFGINRSHCEYLESVGQRFLRPHLYRYTQSALTMSQKINLKKHNYLTSIKQFKVLEKKIQKNESEYNIGKQHELYYNSGRWNEKKNNLNHLIILLQKLHGENYELDLKQMEKSSHQFEEFLFSYRKKLIKYRLQMLKDTIKVCRQIFQCLGQLITLGISQISHMSYEVKKLNLRNSQSEIRSSYRSSYRNSKMQVVKQVKDDQIKRINMYRESLNLLKTFFKKDDLKYQSQNQGNFTLVKLIITDDYLKLEQNIRDLFSSNEHLLAEVAYANQIMKLYLAMREKVVIFINDTLQQIEKKEQLFNKKNDIFQVLDAPKFQKLLLKRKKSIPQELENFTKIEEQFEINDVETIINEFLNNFYRQYEDLGRKCYKVFQKLNHNVSLSKSLMEISSQFTEIRVNQIKPRINEMWLWKDWRDFQFFHSVKINDKLQIDSLKKQSQEIQTLISEEVLGERIPCSVTFDKKYKVILILSHFIQILGDKKEIDFMIPKDHITHIESMKDKIILKTKNNAKFRLSNFKHIDAKQLVIQLQQKYLKQDEVIEIQQQNIQKIVLTEQQLAIISTRKSKIQDKLPKIQDYKKYAEKTYATDIQTAYQLIFSDSGNFPVSSNDKSFFQYLSKKLGNKHFSQSKFDQPGPAFYTGNKDPGITFENCSVFSSRKIQQDHPLPPIPFLPKQCHCVSTDRLYWINHEQFIHQSEVQQTSPAMMTSMINTNIYVVTKIDQNKIKIELLGKTYFTQDVKFKSLLKNGSDGEFKQLLPKILVQMEKVFKIYHRMVQSSKKNKKGKNNGENIKLEEQEKLLLEENESVQKQATQSKTQKYIIGAVIATLILNLLLHFIFS